MKRNPIFIYNDIDKQNLVYANQLTVKQWNDIINKLTAQANANTAFLETWTRWFFGPVEYTTEDEYTDSLGACDSYYDYLKAEFNRIDTRITYEANRLDVRINEEISNREYQDNLLSNRITANANNIELERTERIAQDNAIHDRINVVDTRVATEENNRMSEIERLEGVDKNIRDSIVQENTNWNAADKNLQEQITDNKNKKLNSDLSNLPFASRVHNDDFLVIRCACDGEPATQKISIKVLAELINSEVDYFKGVYADYNSLVSAHPVGEPGDYALVGISDDSLFIQYVWDDKANEGQGVWEETTSTQFVLPEVFSAHQQDLQKGNFVVGKSVISTTAESTSYYTDPDNPTMPKVDIKDLVPKPLEIEVRDEFSNAQGAGTMKELVIDGDVWRVPSDVTSIVFSSIPAECDSYELRTITINGEKWKIPEGSKLDSEPLTLELSSEHQEGANDLGSIRIGEDAWNVEKAFTPLVVGSKLLKGQALTKDIVENEHAVSDIYKFKRVLNGADNGYYTVQFNKDVEGQFNYIFTNTSGSSQNAFNTATLNVVGDYWEVVEITTVEGYRFGSFSDTGKKIKELENKVHSLENSGGGSGGKLTTIAEFTSVDAENNMILFDSLQFEADTLYFAIIENYVVPIYLDATFNSINADFSANFADTLYFMHLFYDGTNAPNKLKLTGQALDGSTFPYISHLSSAKICKL